MENEKVQIEEQEIKKEPKEDIRQESTISKPPITVEQESQAVETRFEGIGQVWNPSTDKIDIVFPAGTWTDNRHFKPGVLVTSNPAIIDRLRKLGYKEVDKNGIAIER